MTFFCDEVASVGCSLGVTALPATAPLENEACIACSKKGRSDLRVYASWGGWLLGKNAGGFDLARDFPSDFYTLHRTQTQVLHAVPSIKQFVGILCVHVIFSHGPTPSAVVGGWSLGSMFAFYAAAELAACAGSPRAVFAFDSRQFPLTPRLDCELSKTSARSAFACGRVQPSSHGLIHMHHLELACFQINSICLHATCSLPAAPPLFWQTDERGHQRCALHAPGSDVQHFEHAEHDTLGVTHRWDIARRLRGAVGEQNGPKRGKRVTRVRRRRCNYDHLAVVNQISGSSSSD